LHSSVATMRLVRLSLLLLTVLTGVAVPAVALAIPAHQDANADILIQTWVLKDGVDPKAPGFNETDLSNWREITNNDIEEPYFLNQGRCSCSTPIRLVLRKKNLANTTMGTGEIWFGSDCANATDMNARDSRCVKLTTFQPDIFQSNIDQPFFVDANVLMFPEGSAAQKGLCVSAQDKVVSVFALIQSGNATTYTSTSHKDYNIDTRPPPLVKDYEVVGSEDGLAVKWTVDATSAKDIWYYQALCSRTDGSPLRDTPLIGDTPQFVDVCKPNTTPTADAGVPPTADAGATDAAPVSGFVPLAADADVSAPDAGGVTTGEPEINPLYLCGSQSAGGSSMTITIPKDVVLAPGELINVRLLVSDKSKNFVDMGTQSASSQPVQDFWEVFNGAGGQVEPGYCFVATAAYGDYNHPFVLVLRDFRDHTLAKFGAGRDFIAWYYRNSPPLAAFIREHTVARIGAQVILWPVVLLAGTWEYTTVLDKLALFAVLAFVIAWRRHRKAARRTAAAPVAASASEKPARGRRHRALAAGAATILLVLCTSHIASAQAVYDDEVDTVDAAPVPSAWVFEIKVGPYYPDVDESAGVSGSRPFERTFGTRKVAMTQMELDRFFLYPGGQLGVTLGLGYYQRTTRSFAQLNGEPDFTGPRAPADNTAFHLMPLTLGAVYRFTTLADRTVVPIVPYAKLGLEYGLWWISKTNGLASVPGKGDASGGSFGWQGALGLSVRMDAFDPGAARNMQMEMGVEHVGFFAELSYANVDGFGDSHKMTVGDATWSAGINFEF
jgi:hypothetical protein